MVNTLAYYDMATIIGLYSNGRILLACTYQTRVEVNGSGKPSRLLRYGNNIRTLAYYDMATITGLDSNGRILALPANVGLGWK